MTCRVATLVMTLAVAQGAHAQTLDLRGLGGRAAGLAGAGSGAIGDASAVVANPAMLSRLEGLSVQIAARSVDQDAAEYSIEGTFDATSLDERFTSAAAFVAWRPGGDEGRLGFGLGVFSPFHMETAWDLEFFRRFDTRIERVELEEVAAGVAFRMGRWSVAAGPRYVSGDIERVVSMSLGSPPVTAFRGEADVRALAEVADWGWSIALDHQRENWGAALVARSPIELRAESQGAKVELVDLFVAVEELREAALDVIEPQLELLESFDYPLAFDLPLELRAAFWLRPSARLMLHLEVAHQQWSEAQSLTPRFHFRSRLPIQFPQERDHDDTFAARLGAELTLATSWRLYLGLADEESFVGEGTLDPGLPAGDAVVFGLGLGWTKRGFGIDAGLNLLDIDDQVRPGTVRDETIETDRRELTVSLRFAL
ncbi:MAG TPA: outer membrane protein transport protein [Thermoanaerobaculia bacterium]|nr:outer membrane protein transport protein [Thermoanaerobaculia bacterium]